MVTQDQFENMPAQQRGLMVYLYGMNADEPHIPNEKNPYIKNTTEYHNWNKGQRIAMVACLDLEL